MILEHLVWSAAFAILVGVIVERKWGYVLPVWIIFACAALPDIDYLIQTVMYPTIFSMTQFFILHGDFHNIVMIIILSLSGAWLLNKYLKINYNDAFICVLLGSSFHVICDFLVYTQPFCPIAPKLNCLITSSGIFNEMGSWHGIGEIDIFMWGGIFLLIAIGLKFYYSENKWIDTQIPNYEET